MSISHLLLVLFLVALNALRFVGLNDVPPGYYVDEAASFTQIWCLGEDGRDDLGRLLPLFAPGEANAIYTPAYLYGQVLWSFLFGHSVAAFRAFSGFISCLTILFLYLWVQKKAGRRIAFYVALSASIMPWVFQFSRIAWDPPVATFFLVLALWATGLSRQRWLAAFPLAMAAYSYSPMRMMAIPFLFFLPALSWKDKTRIFLVFIVICIPLLIYMLDPQFMHRANYLALWGKTFGNPYGHESVLGLALIFIKNLGLFFTPHFLFLTGDPEVRHSIQTFGMLSWLDGLSYSGALFFLLLALGKKESARLSTDQLQLLSVACLGIILAFIPAALTREGLPNALRALAAWPFFALLTGLALSIIEQRLGNKRTLLGAVLTSVIFYSFYLWDYFYEYPKRAEKSFLSNQGRIAGAYPKLLAQTMNCEQLRKMPPLRFENPIKLNQALSFAEGGTGSPYLGRAWPIQEPWGRWSEGNWADLEIPMPDIKPQSIQLKLRAFVSGALLEQKVEVWMNGAYQTTIILRQFENNVINLVIPKNIQKDALLWLDFYLPNAQSPNALGLGADRRRLGIGIEALEFH